jgi:hypothetical protein
MPAIYGVLVSCHFIGCVGIWYFKQWGVQLYLMAFFAKTIFYLTTNQLGVSFYTGIIFTPVFIFILLRHYRKMNPNL